MSNVVNIILRNWLWIYRENLRGNSNSGWALVWAQPDNRLKKVWDYSCVKVHNFQMQPATIFSEGIYEWVKKHLEKPAKFGLESLDFDIFLEGPFFSIFFCLIRFEKPQMNILWNFYFSGVDHSSTATLYTIEVLLFSTKFKILTFPNFLWCHLTSSSLHKICCVSGFWLCPLNLSDQLLLDLGCYEPSEISHNSSFSRTLTTK